MNSSSPRLWIGSLALLTCSTLSAGAAVTWLQADLDGVQSATGSAATGKGLVSYNDATGQLTWTVSWKDIPNTATDLHFHGPAAPGINAGVQVGIGTASNPISGTATITPVQAADLLAGLWYLNVHTSDFPSGEIRGQVLRAMTNYWSMEEGTGTTTANAVPAGNTAQLNGGVSWVTDATRGSVLGFDGIAGTYVNAAQIGPISTTQDFTWTFWSNTDPAQPVNNDVILGNRQPDAGWTKFTPNQFEYRDLAATFNTGLNYPNFVNGTWVHNAVVKSGANFTYYRNGIALVGGVANGTLPELTPMYFGGDATATGEGWQGLIDEVATWKAALPLRAIQGLAAGTYKPNTAPLIVPAPVLAPIMSDNFSGDLSKWTATTRGLESNAAAGYDAPLVRLGTVTLGGTTNSQYWFGTSLESVDTFDSRVETEVSVKRVLLDYTGTAGRASLWIFGDNAHYLHFSQNRGENGWQYNARDDGGAGTLQPTGGGNNLALLDPLDGEGGEHVMSLRLIPGAAPGSVNIQMFLDGNLAGAQGFTNFPNNFKVILTGQARAIGDLVTAQFDDVQVTRLPVANLPPVFTSPSYVLASATAGSAYTATLAGRATDPESGTLTFSALSGPAWLSLAANGALSGTPGAGDTGVGSMRVRVTDPGGLTSEATLSLRIQESTVPPATLYGWWPLNDGAGTVVRSVSGPAAPGTLSNDQFGGLGLDGATWVTEPGHGMVLSFNGVDATGAFVTVGSPPDSGNFPAPGLSGDFTLTCRVKSNQGPNNDIIIGNRYDAFGADFAPRQFIKLTTSAFEWHWNGIGENADIPDLPQNVWMHFSVVKDGPSLTSYRNGVPTATATITGAPDLDLPLFFGGQGVENWSGYLSDIRLFSTALTDAQIAAVVLDTTLPTGSFSISSVSMDAARRVTLTWPTSPGFSYAVWASTDPTNPTLWKEVVDALTTGSYTVQPGGNPNTATENRIYYQIRAFAAP